MQNPNNTEDIKESGKNENESLIKKLDYKRVSIIILFLLALLTIDFAHSIKQPNIVIRHHVINPPIGDFKLFKKK